MSSEEERSTSRSAPRRFGVALPLGIVGVAFLAAFYGLRSISRVRTVEELRPLALEAAKRVSLDPNLLLALVVQESGGNPTRRSTAGAIGLTQLKPAAAADAARSLGEPAPTPDDLLDPATNLRLGAAYLRIMLDRFHDEEVALAAYFRGPEWIEKSGGAAFVRERLKRPSEVATYVHRIQDLAKLIAARTRSSDAR